MCKSIVLEPFVARKICAVGRLKMSYAIVAGQFQRLRTTGMSYDRLGALLKDVSWPLE